MREVVEDGLRTGVESGRGELGAELEDGVDDWLLDLMGTGGWPVRPGLEASWSVAPVASEEFVEPAARDRVLAHEPVGALLTKDDRLDQVPRQLHAATSSGGPVSPETCYARPVR